MIFRIVSFLKQIIILPTTSYLIAVLGGMSLVVLILSLLEKKNSYKKLQKISMHVCCKNNKNSRIKQTKLENHCKSNLCRNEVF